MLSPNLVKLKMIRITTIRMTTMMIEDYLYLYFLENKQTHASTRRQTDKTKTKLTEEEHMLKRSILAVHDVFTVMSPT